MDSYHVELKQSAEKDLRGLPRQIIRRVFLRLKKLAVNPFENAVKLVGTEDSYRIRVGDYRVVYKGDPADKHVWVIYIRHRREAYRGL